MDIYLSKTEKGYVLTREFYDLGLKEKLVLVDSYIDSGLLTDWKFYERIVKALLQHSEKDLKRDHPVKGERKQRKAAKEADQRDDSDD